MATDAEQMPIPQGMPYESPMTSLGSIVSQLTNPEDLVNQLELKFRSQVVQLDGTIHNISKPLMNDNGINAIMGEVRSIVNQVTVLSNLTKYNIQAMMSFANLTITKDLMMNRATYGITDPTARDRIHFMALSTIFICMQRCLEEGERRFLKGSVQELRTTIDSPNSGRGGVIGSILGWRKK